MDQNPPRNRTERRIVALSVAMALCFGPIGIAVGRIPLFGAQSESPARWLGLTAWFALYGLVMGLALAFAWRVENPGQQRRRRARQAKEDYWIGDWNAVLEATPGAAEPPAPGDGVGVDPTAAPPSQPDVP